MRRVNVVVLILVALVALTPTVHADQKSNVIRALQNHNVLQAGYSYTLFGYVNITDIMGLNKTGSFIYQDAIVTYHQDIDPSGVDWGIIINYPTGPTCHVIACPMYVLVIVAYGSNFGGGILYGHNAEMRVDDGRGQLYIFYARLVG